jgi:hypothetical protein
LQKIAFVGIPIALNQHKEQNILLNLTYQSNNPLAKPGLILTKPQYG